MQLPLGTWLDRHGPKTVILCFLSAAVLGCVAFAMATSFSGLLAARLLCGAGVSACLMAPLTGYRRWFDAWLAQLRANSWMLMTGSLGMLASTLPVQWLLPCDRLAPVLFWGMAGLVFIAMAVIAMAGARLVAGHTWCASPASGTWRLSEDVVSAERGNADASDTWRKLRQQVMPRSGESRYFRKLLIPLGCF